MAVLFRLATSQKITGSNQGGVTGIFYSHNDHGVYSVSNRNEYQDYVLGSKRGRCVGLTTLPSSCAHVLEIWESQIRGNFKASPGL